MKKRIPYFAALVAGASLSVTAFAAQPQSAAAQSQAEQMCAEHGVQPRSAAWELCLSHVTRANEWGERALAHQLARAAGDAGAAERTIHTELALVWLQIDALRTHAREWLQPGDDAPPAAERA